MRPDPLQHHRDVETLHFLVHPGFGMDHSKRLDREGRELFDRYAAKAAELGDDGMLLAYLWRATPENGMPYERFVHERICALKEELRDRMIVVSDGLKLFRDEEGLKDDFIRARDVAYNRGYWIDEATDIVAYGEAFTQCVPHATAILWSAIGKFFRPTISAHNTNLGVRVGETLREQRARFAELAKTVRFSGMDIDWTVPVA